MKKQIYFLHRPSIVFIFLTMLCLLVACQSHSQNNKAKLPSIDIHTAVASGNMDALKQNIAAGADINEKDPIGGSSPLITACVFGKKEMAKALIDAGAAINYKNNDGSTPLISAAFFCRPEIVQLLLAKKADKSIKNKYGQTAYTSVNGPFETVKSVYEGIGKMLASLGLKLDLGYIEKTRPVIADMLQ